MINRERAVVLCVAAAVGLVASSCQPQQGRWVKCDGERGALRICEMGKPVAAEYCKTIEAYFPRWRVTGNKLHWEQYPHGEGVLKGNVTLSPTDEPLCDRHVHRWRTRTEYQTKLLDHLHRMAFDGFSKWPDEDTRFIDTPVTQLAGQSLEYFQRYCASVAGGLLQRNNLNGFEGAYCKFVDPQNGRLVYNGRDPNSAEQVALEMWGIPRTTAGRKYIRWFYDQFGNPVNAFEWISDPSDPHAGMDIHFTTVWRNRSYNIVVTRKYSPTTPGYVGFEIQLTKR